MASGKHHRKQDPEAATQFTPSFIPPDFGENPNSSQLDSGIALLGLPISQQPDSLQSQKSSSSSSGISFEHLKRDEDLIHRLSEAMRQCKHAKVTAVDNPVRGEEAEQKDKDALKKLAESLVGEVYEWLIATPPPSPSNSSDDQLGGLVEQNRDAIEHEQLTLEMVISGIQSFQDYWKTVEGKFKSSLLSISTPLLILQLGFFSICQPLEAVPKLHRKTNLGMIECSDEKALPEHCKWFMDETKLQVPAVERQNGSETCIDHNILAWIRNAVIHGHMYALGLDTAAPDVPKVIVLKKNGAKYRKVIEMTILEFVDICNKVRTGFLDWNLVAKVETFKNVVCDSPTQVSSTTDSAEQV